MTGCPVNIISTLASLVLVALAQEAISACSCTVQVLGTVNDTMCAFNPLCCAEPCPHIENAVFYHTVQELHGTLKAANFYSMNKYNIAG